MRYFRDEDEAKAIKKTGSVAGVSATTTQLPSDVGMTKEGTADLGKLFAEKAFPYPKPVELIKYLIQIGTVNKEDALVLDFFAGSGTTAQALMRMNAQNEGSNRRFILCTNNENNICRDVTLSLIHISKGGHASCCTTCSRKKHFGSAAQTSPWKPTVPARLSRFPPLKSTAWARTAPCCSARLGRQRGPTAPSSSPHALKTCAFPPPRCAALSAARTTSPFRQSITHTRFPWTAIKMCIRDRSYPIRKRL